MRRGKFTTVYDPLKSQKKDLLEELKNNNHFEILAPPISCTMTFYMPIPKSLSEKKKKELIGTDHFKKPDIDNLIKFYWDMLEGTCFKNDSNITSIDAKKVYDENPRTELFFEHINS